MRFTATLATTAAIQTKSNNKVSLTAPSNLVSISQDAQGIVINSVYHCNDDCRVGEGEPTYGIFAYFDCTEAEGWAGFEMEHNSYHDVLQNGETEAYVKLQTGVDNWSSSTGENDCAIRIHPWGEANPGDWSVGDTFTFLDGAVVETETESETEVVEEQTEEQATCQIQQEFYWALMQILDRDNDGLLSVAEFEEAGETMTGTIGFGDSDSLLDWFYDNAIRTNPVNGRQIVSRDILDQAGQGELTDEDYMALDILIYYSDAFYSMPGWDGDGIMLMNKLSEALDDMSSAISGMADEGLVQALDSNGDDQLTWEEAVPYIQDLCDAGSFNIADYQPLP